MSVNQFYETYWKSPQADPERGQLVEQRKLKLTAALADVSRGAKVADLGCGEGVFTNLLRELGFDSVGVDMSATVIAHARHLYPEARFEVASLAKPLPFADQEFAAVWCSEVLEHLFDVQAALSEIYRVLRPGGMAVITCPYHGLMKNLVISLSGYDRHYDPAGGHIRFFTRSSLKKCLEQACFSEMQMSGIGRFWPVWMSHFVVARKSG